MAPRRLWRYAGVLARFPGRASVVTFRDPEGAIARSGHPRVRIPSLPMRTMSRTRLYLTLVLTGLILTPAVGVAQGAAQTHTVKKGDTLWDLAQQYLGDPFRWPEIYRRNTETVKDANLIYPDQVLVISGDVAPTVGTPADVVAPRDSAAAAAAAVSDTMFSLPSAAGGGAMQPQPVYVQKPMTIFNPDRFRAQRAGARQSLQLTVRGSAVRPGDYLRAPFLWDANGVTGAGKVGAAILTDAIRVARESRPMQIYERLYITLPAGAAGRVGDQFLTFRYGPTVPNEGRVVVPTGVLKLLGAPANGRAEALLLTKFEEVFIGQGVIETDTLAMPSGVVPSRVEFGARTTLVWVYDDPVVASVGHHVILGAGKSDGLMPGDQVTIQRALGLDPTGGALPPEDVVVVQITRVTNWGASAIIIGQTDGVLEPGLQARVTAKMP